ncbi:iron reductase [Mycena galericulata]|nr:iron reductase [Mycena galericulata]
MEPPFRSLKTVDPDRIPRIALANLYPKQVWYFLAVFIALVSAWHFVSTLHGYWTRQDAPREKGVPRRHGASWRRLPLAILNLSRTMTFRWSITLAGGYTLSVADVLLATMYIAVLFTWTFINSKNSLGQKYDPKYWANRCAHIAGSQLPLMTALGMKNNFVSFLTGVSFDKLEHLHRTTARVICVMLWVHGFGRIYLGLADDSSQSWFRYGVMGASALTLLCFLSIRPLRSRNYEVFMYVHLAFGVTTLAGAYVHAAHFGYQVYIWPALFLWGLDRTLRFARIVFVNSQLFKEDQRKVASDAKVTILSPHFLRVLVDAPPYLRWRAGQSAYITILSAYKTSLTEAHPFTIANAPFEVRREALEEGDSISEDAVTTKSDREKVPSGETDKVASPGSDDHQRLMFILRVREGFTRRLLDSVAGNPDPTGVSKSFKALIDGPYSSPPILKGFETVVLICGGSGVSFMLPLFLDLVQAARVNANPKCTRIVFVWAIRDPDQVNWIAGAMTDTLLGLHSGENLKVLDIDIRLHITAAPEDTQSMEGEGSTVDPELAGGTAASDSDPEIAGAEKMVSTRRRDLLAIPGVHFLRGRPDIKTILQTEIEAACGAVSVNVCGTTELAQSVRYALGGGSSRFVDVLRGGPSVSLHVEGFGSE